jgi:hypothetical protein
MGKDLISAASTSEKVFKFGQSGHADDGLTILQARDDSCAKPMGAGPSNDERRE